MNKLKKTLVKLVLIIFIISIIDGCTINMFDMDGFESKEQVINAIKMNINDLNILTQEIYYKFKDGNERVIIENSFFKIFNSSYEYKTKLSNRIFKNMKLKEIYIDYEKKRIEYFIRHKFGTYCGFYYSFDDNSCYNQTKNRLDVIYAQHENWNIELVYRSGWYTEKIFNNWYFYENDFDNLYFLNYIKDDIIQMDIYDEVYKRFNKYFNY